MPDQRSAGEVVTETFDYGGGRQVTVYIPADPPEAVVFAGDGQLISQWGGVLEAADVPYHRRHRLGAPLQARQARAQSDLAALRHDDNFAGDLRALSSDAHLTGPDLAATKGDAALGADCYNVSTGKIDATILKRDASIVGIDLSTLTADIGTVTQDVAAMKNDLANLTASGLPATPGASAAIAAAGKAIGQAAAKANSEIDQVNADVTQAYSIASGMATGSCAGDGPGRPPVPIGHIPGS